jgi:hypothetical protein
MNYLSRYQETRDSMNTWLQSFNLAFSIKPTEPLLYAVLSQLEVTLKGCITDSWADTVLVDETPGNNRT